MTMHCATSESKKSNVAIMMQFVRQKGSQSIKSMADPQGIVYLILLFKFFSRND